MEFVTTTNRLVYTNLLTYAVSCSQHSTAYLTTVIDEATPQ